MSQLRGKHMQRLRLVHFICPDCIFESTNEETLRAHLQENHHDVIVCPHPQCGARFHRISQCQQHIVRVHRADSQLSNLLMRVCNRPQARVFNYNGIQYNPNKEMYFEFQSKDYLRNFFGY